MDAWVTINRSGYGSNFNNLCVSGGKLKKEASNEYGKFKLEHEKAFYKFVIDSNIDFPIPKIYEIGNNYMIMEYMTYYKPLYQTFFNLDYQQQNLILANIKEKLTILHMSNALCISKEQYTRLVIMEACEKVLKRYDEIRHVIEKYSHIKKVNNIRLTKFEDMIKTIKCCVLDYIESVEEYTLHPIHGDCQFNNVLFNSGEIVFIDPRGYFGSSKIFGIKEYDIAKIHFALSGYDVFDNSNIDQLQINGDELKIDNYDSYYDVHAGTSQFITCLVTSIWLGNAHCFKHNECKLITSYFFALYFGTKYLQNQS